MVMNRIVKDSKKEVNYCWYIITFLNI